MCLLHVRELTALWLYAQREGRAHFGYPELQGVELENQGGEGTALQHWEKRLLGVQSSSRPLPSLFISEEQS